MRIAHVRKGMWEPGGVASYIRRVAEAQRRAGHEVLFLDPAPAGRPPGPGFEPVPVGNGTGLYQAARRQQVDLLHLHGPAPAPPPSDLPAVRTLHGHHPYCLSGSQFWKRPGEPCPLTYAPAACMWGHVAHRCGSVRPANVAAAFRRLQVERATLSRVPAIAVSGFLRERMIRAGYPPDRVWVLHLFAPPAGPYVPLPPARSGPPRFLFLGRLGPEKGLDWLLRSFRRVRVPARLDVAGAGPEESRVRELAGRLGLDARVRFHGWVDAEHAARLIRQARALVFPSLWHEPGGTVAFEAMAHGRAVIMSRVGGMPEVVEEGTNGLLAEPGDEQGLARAMETLAADRDLARRLGEQGRRLAARRYSQQRHMERLHQIYRAVVEGRDAQPLPKAREG